MSIEKSGEPTETNRLPIEPDPFETAVSKALPRNFWRYGACLAVSGGADSTALLRSVAALARRRNVSDRIFVAHVDHGMRGEESSGDARFVREIAKELGLRCEVARLEKTRLERETRRTGSEEAAARNLRYETLLELAQRYGARTIVCAHTVDDQMETILYRLFRGTGMTGLKAIPSLRPINEAVVLVRPMLGLRRGEVEAYLARLGANWRTDSSNASGIYTRNRIRAQLIPILNEIFPDRWRASLLRIAETAEELDDYFEEQAAALEKKVAARRSGDGTIALPTDSFDGVHVLVVRAYFRRLWRIAQWPLGEMGRRQWQRLHEMILARDGVQEYPGGIRVRVDENLVLLERDRIGTS